MTDSAPTTNYAVRNAIPHNCTAHEALPPAVRDLADLLAEIAFRRLRAGCSNSPIDEIKRSDP